MYNAFQTRCPGRRARMAGVSLIEVLIVIGLGTVLTMIGVASYKSITTSYRISGEINGLLGDMQYARSEAIRQGQSVAICVSSSGTDCAAGNTSWNQGWIVFVEPTTGTASTGGNGALVLRKQVPFTSTDTFTDGVTSNVVFDREGLALALLTTQSGAGGAMIPLHDATANATRTRCLQVTNVGNVSVQLPAATNNCS